MSQEITILVLVDIAAALKANALEGNVYFIDNLRREGSKGEGSGNLVTAVNGSHWSDGSQAAQPLLNWLPSGIGSIPRSLPRTYAAKRGKSAAAKSLQSVKELHDNQDVKDLKDFKGRLKLLTDSAASSSQIKDANGNVRSLPGVKTLNVKGETFTEEQDNLSHLSPLITDITGEAVDKQVLFPAQYGTPIIVKDGWYWSATVDTYKPGVYGYTLHITLYDLVSLKGVPTWEPKEMTCGLGLKVTSRPMKNGFTNGATSLLPIPCQPPEKRQSGT